MNKEKAELIVSQLLNYSAGLQYGAVSMSIKIHNGRVFEVSYTKTEQVREKETKQEPN
jgi:hypothetical protein